MIMIMYDDDRRDRYIWPAGCDPGLRPFAMMAYEAALAHDMEPVPPESEETQPIDLLINCAGVLHSPEGLRPEKRLQDFLEFLDV